jgi:hypothetical protein
VFEQVDSIFGLTTVLGLSREAAFEVVKEVVAPIASSYASKPSAEAIIKRIKRSSDQLSEVVVSKILELVDKPTPQQLEYIIARGRRAVLPEAQKLYKLAIAYKMEDAVNTLRYTWNTYMGKGFVTCPKCGFNAVTPDGYCTICGYVVSSNYIRSALGFDEKFNTFLKTASVAELNEVLQFGYVLVGERGIYSPRSKRASTENPVLYPISLRKSEISQIIEEISSRKLPI